MGTHRRRRRYLILRLFGAFVFGMASAVGPIHLFAQVTSRPQEPDETQNQGSLGQTCSVSTSDQAMVGHPDRGQTRALATNQWRKKVLNVRFLDGQDPWNQSVRQKVQAIVKEWERYANLRFTFEPAVAADIAITLERSRDYPRYGLYQSAYGPESARWAQRGSPSMWLLFAPDTPDEEIRRIVLHEFGHAIGLIHEQKRPDAPIVWNEEAVYEYYAFSGWDRDRILEQVMKPFGGPFEAASPFDPNSIMIYPIPAGLANIVVDWTKELSPMDKLFISLYYPFETPAAPVRSISVDGPPQNSVIDRSGKYFRYQFTVPRDGRYTIEASGSTPVLMGIFGSSIIAANQNMAATEGADARIVADLKADHDNLDGRPMGTYDLIVRHQEPRTGLGEFSVTIRNR